MMQILFFTLFFATGLLLHPLKTSKNLKFPDVSTGHRKRPAAKNGLTNEKTHESVTLELQI